MPLNQYGLGLIFTAKDQASGTIGKIGKAADMTSEQTERMQQQFFEAGKQMAKGTAMIAGGITVLRGITRLTKEFAGFEAVVASTAAIAGASQKQYDGLFKAAQAAGKATIFSPQQAALGMRTLAMAGLDVKASITALNPVLEMATASFGMLSPEQAAGLATMAMKGFGIEADKLTDAVGRMVFATTSANMSMRDLQLGLSVAARGAIATNQSLSETLISLGLVKNVVKGTERASTSLAVAMERLARPTVQKQLKKTMGVTVAVGGKFRSFLDVVRDVTEATSKMTDVKRAATLQDIFGAEAALSLLAIMKQIKDGIKTQSGEIVKGAQAVEFLRQRMVGAKDVSKIMTEKYMKTLEGQMRLLQGSMQTLRIAVGGLFAKTWMPIIKGLVTAVNTLLELLEKMPGPLKEIARLVIPMGALLVTIAGVVKVLGALKMMAGIAAMAKTMSAATAGAGVAMAGAAKSGGMLSRVMGPFGGPWGLAITGAIVAIGFAFKRLNERVQRATKEWKGWTEAAKLAKQTFSDVIDLERGENKQAAQLILSIKNRRTARVAVVGIEKLMADQQAKTIAVDAKLHTAQQRQGLAQLKVQKLLAMGHLMRGTKMMDVAKHELELSKIAVSKAESRKNREIGIATGLARQKQEALAKLTQFEIKSFKLGTTERFKAEVLLTANLMQQERIKRAAILAFQQEKLKDVDKLEASERKLRLETLQQMKKHLAATTAERIKRAKAAVRAGVTLPGMTRGVAREAVRVGVMAKMRATPEATVRLQKRLSERRVTRGVEDIAAMPIFGDYLKQMVQQAIEQRREQKLMPEQIGRRVAVAVAGAPMVVSLEVDGETLAKTVRRAGERRGERQGKVATAPRR